MPSLTNKHVILGVTGGISAYKSAEIVRLLRAAGACVRVVMTAAAQEFITPLTMQALSGYPVATDLLDRDAEAAMGHIELARWADCIVIAPATADSIAGLAAGSASNLLLTLCLASRCPVAIAPAMNQAMWGHLATVHNVSTLDARGVKILGPGEGEQACGDVGLGRMLEPRQIVEYLEEELFQTSVTLRGKQVTITAGPTQEAIDPVRYLSNRSSGKMGYALAQAAAEVGANVVLISGPTSLKVPEQVKCLPVVSARQMHSSVMDCIEATDIFIGAAAVADFRPKKVETNKIKKGKAESLVLEMERNPDIIAAVASHPRGPFTIGFAAETTNVASYAKEKLLSKKLDVIVANDVSMPGGGFDSDDNAVTVFYGDNERYFKQQPKLLLAKSLISLLAELYSKNN